MNRNKVERFDEKAAESRDSQLKSSKVRLEKSLVAGALIVILMALLVIPKYEAYQENQMILAEKAGYNQGLPDEMTEETYLKQLKKIDEELSVTRIALPERLDSVSLYEAVVKKAEAAQVSLTSLDFEPPDIVIEDQLGMKINGDFIQREEKSITGPDGKFLTTCQFTAVCSGNDDTLAAFLNEINQSAPAIRVISYQIEKGATNEKKLRLIMASYAVQDKDENNKATCIQ